MAQAQVTRPRLTRLLDALSDRRLVSVVADAGSGKTTAVRAWADARATPTAWLGLTSDHAEPARLLADLVAATSPLCPGLRDALAPELAARTEVGQLTDDAASASVLAGALATAWGTAGAIAVVLDDVHVVDGGPGRAFLTDLVRLCPDGVQLVLLGRADLPFGVARLRATGRFGEVGPKALQFDAAEVAALFAHVGIPVGDEDARAVVEACAGWATAVRLAVESALTAGTDHLLEQVRSSAQAASHLSETVLLSLETSTRRLLRELSVLGPLPRAALAGRPAERSALDALAERGLLVRCDAAGWALTPLARFAVQRADRPSPVETRRLLRSGAAEAIALRLSEPALRWALALEDAGLVARVVARCGRDLLDDLAVAPLVRAAELLPTPVGDADTDALLAELWAQRGCVQRALAHLGALDATVALPAGTARRIAAALWAQGESTHAAEVLARAAGTGTPADLSLLDAVAATLAWGRGDGDGCRALADRALARAEDSGDDAALASAWVAQALAAVLDGDLGRNEQAYAHALEHADAAGDVLTQVRIHCNTGSRLNETGDYAAALLELAEAVRLGEASGQTTRVALARHNQGDARLGLGQVEQALQEYDAALAIWSALDSPMAAYAHQGRGDALARRGDTARAAAAYREAVALGERLDNAQVLVPALAGLARVEHSEDPDAAAALVKRALAEPASVGSLPAWLAAGWLAVAAGDQAAAADWARRTRTEAGRRHDPAALAEALSLAVLAEPAPRADDGRLVEAHGLWTELDNPVGVAEVELLRAWLGGDTRGVAQARGRLRGLGVRDSVARVAGVLGVLGEQQQSAVVLRTLGAFTVFRDGRAVPASAWQSRKARDLVKILASRRGKAVSRETLAELLWPGSGAEATGNRLSVALSTARSVLDPDRAHPADHYLVGDRGAVSLDLRTCSLDLVDFLDRADVALAATAAGSPDAVALLQSATAAYPGDFCEEDPYEAWAAATRDELRARHHEVLRTLAELLVATDRPDAAVPWLITLLGADPHDEPTHLRLVATLVRTGRHGEARRSYRAYAERMAEIDVEPAAFPQARTTRPAA